MKTVNVISAKVSISNLEMLGWDFDNIYQEVSEAQDISMQKAEEFEKENYHVKMKVDESGILTYSLCQNAEYGNEEFDQGDCGDNEAGLQDLQRLIDHENVWDLKIE